MKVGSLVECIDNKPREAGKHLNDMIVPEKNYPYVVRGFNTCPKHGNTGVYLEEIINNERMMNGKMIEPGYNIDRFRELQPPIDLSELLEEKVTCLKNRL